MSIENIAQKSAADFMKIDETDIGIKIPASYDGQPGKLFNCFHFFQFTTVNPFPYTLPIKNQCFLVLMEIYFLKYLMSIFFISPLNIIVCNVYLSN